MYDDYQSLEVKFEDIEDINDIHEEQYYYLEENYNSIEKKYDRLEIENNDLRDTLKVTNRSCRNKSDIIKVSSATHYSGRPN